jgi:hypothetical protein
MARPFAAVVFFFVSLSNLSILRSDDGEVARPRALEEGHFDYPDHLDHHIVSDVRAVVTRGAETTVTIVVSASGPAVKPPPGFQHLTGSNVITAEEMDDLARENRLTVEALHDGGSQLAPVKEGRRTHLRMRRYVPGEPIDFEALSTREYLLELSATIPAIEPGTHRIDWRVDGQARLRVVLEVDNGDDGDGDARILSVESVDPETSWRDRFAIELVARIGLELASAVALVGVDEPKVEPPVDMEEWQARDLEGRWVLSRRAIDENRESARAWVGFLARQDEFELLELIAITDPRSFGMLGIGEALSRAEAPESIRVDAWTLQAARDSHTQESAKGTFLLRRPSKTLAWLKEFPQSGTAMESLRRELEAMNLEPAESHDALPPLRAEVVFALLDAPEELADFGDRKRVELGKVYVHQVLRTIDAFVASRIRDEVFLAQLRKLTRHKDLEVRRRALLAHAHFESKHIPHEEFLRVSDDKSESPLIREAAFLGASYSGHPAIYARLHNLAVQPSDPAWKAAVSRLGDIGDAFTLRHLEALTEKCSAQERGFIEKEIARVRERVESQRAYGAIGVDVQTMLERAAWVDLQCDSLESTLVRWTLETIHRHAKAPEVREKLAKIREEYVPRWKGKTLFGTLEDRVRNYAGLILDGKGGLEAKR